MRSNSKEPSGNQNTITAIRQSLMNNIENYQRKKKDYFDAKRCKPRTYIVGDLVLLKIIFQPSIGHSRKPKPIWKGPFRVSKALGQDRYEVKDIPGMMRSQIPYVGVAGTENMKPWIQF